jgi:simple sugar transport system ATP-binding protein
MPRDNGVLLLEINGVSKAYGHVQALTDVSMHVDSGEIVGLVGDNGAGKSTLVKVIAGAHRPDGGTIVVSGEVVEFHSPLDARERGIETVYQDLALAPDLPVWANLFLGREEYVGGPGRVVGWMNKRAMRRRAQTELSRLGIPLSDVDVAVEDLSGGERQAIAVARSIAWGKRLVMMDEPRCRRARESRGARPSVGGRGNCRPVCQPQPGADLRAGSEARRPEAGTTCRGSVDRGDDA